MTGLRAEPVMRSNVGGQIARSHGAMLRLIFTVLVLLVSFWQIAARAADSALEIKLTEAPSNQGALTIQESITNRYDQRVRVLRWALPEQNTMTAALFDIRDGEGQHVKYTWIMMKRRAPRAEDFLVLEPNQTVTYDIDLDKFYQIAGKQHLDISLDERYFLYGFFLDQTGERRPPEIHSNHLEISR